MSIVFQWDLKLIFWHCHIYEKTLITGIISSEKTIWSQVHGGVPAAPIQLEGEEQLREAESQNSQVKKKLSLFSHSSTFPTRFFPHFCPHCSDESNNPQEKTFFPQILYAIFCLDLLLLSSSYPQYPSTGSTGLSLIITAFHPPRCLLTHSKYN